MRKHVTIATSDDSLVALHGEVMLDASEGTLIIQGDEGAYMAFNWNHVLFFAVQDITDACSSE